MVQRSDRLTIPFLLVKRNSDDTGQNVSWSAFKGATRLNELRGKRRRSHEDEKFENKSDWSNPALDPYGMYALG